MAKNEVDDCDTTAANNTDVGGIALSNSTTPTQIDDIVREVMRQIKVKFTSKGQYAFPAAQNASSDANTLDDYEENTWTPTPSSSSGTLSGWVITSASYTKFGNRVAFDINAQIANIGTGSGSLRFTLPFTPGVLGAGGATNSSTGTALSCLISTDGLVVLSKYDGTFPVANGNIVRVGGIYRV